MYSTCMYDGSGQCGTRILNQSAAPRPQHACKIDPTLTPCRNGLSFELPRTVPDPTPVPRSLKRLLGFRRTRAIICCCGGQVDLRETISLMQSYGSVKQQQPFPKHRSTNSGRLAPGLIPPSAGAPATAPAATNAASSGTANDLPKK